MPHTASGTVSGYLPVSSHRSDTGFWPEGKRSGDEAVSMQIWNVDHDYVRTMGMEIALGRDFSEAFGADSSAIIRNEKAAQSFGFADPVGKGIHTFSWTPDRGVDPSTFLISISASAACTRPSSAWAIFSASSPAWRFSPHLWVCSAWRLSRPRNAPRKSAFAK